MSTNAGTSDRRKAGAARTPLAAAVVVRFCDRSGAARALSGRAVDQSANGLGLVLPCSVEIGAQVSVEVHAEPLSAAPRTCEGIVRWCRRRNDNAFGLGIAFAASASIGAVFEDDLYDILQVNMNADLETIHKVYRFLAIRYHPDNAQTGDAAHFRKLVEAYRILTDPEKRAAFDVWHRNTFRRQWRIFESSNVTTGPAAEKRKRNGVLQALYTKRMADPDQPWLSFRDFENLLGCPREHLEFALWYLKEHGCINRSDNGRFQITVAGVDAAESVMNQDAGTRVLPQITGT